MFWIAEAMVRWLAPILSFTAEEIWRYMPGARNESVFLNTWVALPQGADAASADRLGRGPATCAAASMRELEKLRNADAIGAPLDAEVDVYCAPHVLQTSAVVRRGAAVRVHHVRSARASRPTAVQPTRRRRRRANDDFAWIVARPIGREEVRALLAQARGRRQRCASIRSCAAAA